MNFEKCTNKKNIFTIFNDNVSPTEDLYRRMTWEMIGNCE